MIPWGFAYDKVNYARFMSYYYAIVSRLPIDPPEVNQQVMQGGFSVQFGSQNPFGRIPVDQTIEETVNRDTQTAGGTDGFSMKRAAVSLSGLLKNCSVGFRFAVVDGSISLS